MSGFLGPFPAVPTGSSGNATGASLRLHPAAQKTCFVLVVETAGSTPQISWKVQGCLDSDQIADGSVNWFDLGLITPASDSVAAIPIVVNPAPAGTSSMAWLGPGTPKGASTRFVKRVRVVTSGAVNMTSYRVEMTQHVL